jgi:hypothetical protein
MKYASFCVAILTIVVAFMPKMSMAQTHCQANEVNLYSGKVDSNPSKPGAPEKFVSLCADEMENMRMVTYRFGVIGKVEMEISAPNDGKIHVEEYDELMPPMSYNVFSFIKGKTTYSLALCASGMCIPSHLMVFSGKKEIAARYSDSEHDSGVFQETGVPLDKLSPSIFTKTPSGIDFSQ